MMKRRVFLHAWMGALSSRPLFRLLKAPRIPRSPFPENGPEKTSVLVKVLGTAQDGGIPHIGCFCPNCERARKDPRYLRLISSLGIFDLEEGHCFIIDATPDIRSQTQIMRDRVNGKKFPEKFVPDGFLLTHAHIGHYTGLMFYGYEGQSADLLPVFCSKRMAAFLTNNGPWSQLVQMNNIRLQPISPDKAFALTPSVTIIPFQVPHRDEYTDTLGFKISGKKRTLLYISDIHSWESWKKSVVAETKKVDVALLDGTFYSPEELPIRDLSSIGHPSIKHSIQVLKDVARESRTDIYFTHLNHSNLALYSEGEPQITLQKEGFHLASDGMEFYL
jgi:pyrroloquinoline quinone biosynthesis protein B